MKSEPILGGIANTAADRCEPLLRAGNTNCGGCGMSIALNMMSRAIADRPVQMVIPACCGIVTAGSFPFSAYGAPIVASTFAGAAAVATGLARVARSQRREDARGVLCRRRRHLRHRHGHGERRGRARRRHSLHLLRQRDLRQHRRAALVRDAGGCLDLHHTGAAKRHEKKDMLSIMASHRIPYAASLSLAHTDDMMRKLRRALDARGFRFLHILAPVSRRGGSRSRPKGSS